MVRSMSDGLTQRVRFMLEPFYPHYHGEYLHLSLSQIPCVYVSSFQTNEAIGDLFAEEYDLIKKQPHRLIYLKKLQELRTEKQMKSLLSTR